MLLTAYLHMYFFSLTINADQIVVALLCALRIFSLICLSQPLGIQMLFKELLIIQTTCMSQLLSHHNCILESILNVCHAII